MPGPGLFLPAQFMRVEKDDPYADSILEDHMYPKVITVGDKLKRVLSNLKSSEVAEALIATWCVEYLRVRRLGGFNVVEIVAISLLMLSVKAIVLEANRRRYNDKARTFVMSTGSTRMGRMGVNQYSTRSHTRHGRSAFRQRRFNRGDPYQDL